MADVLSLLLSLLETVAIISGFGVLGYLNNKAITTMATRIYAQYKEVRDMDKKDQYSMIALLRPDYHGREIETSKGVEPKETIPTTPPPDFKCPFPECPGGAHAIRHAQSVATKTGELLASHDKVNESLDKIRRRMDELEDKQVDLAGENVDDITAVALCTNCKLFINERSDSGLCGNCVGTANTATP